MNAQTVIDTLQHLADKQQAILLQGFFKTGKGQYGEGDVFWGIKTPKTRQVAKSCRDISLAEIEKLIKHPVHEVRLCALLILTEQFKKSNQAEKKSIADFYLSHTSFINNWDLVDLSCYNILGNYLIDKPRDVLYQLAKSENIWEQRIAIVSTWAFIRNDEFEDTLSLSEMLLGHSHDLIHKAMGWMLREIYKRDAACVIDFIQTHYKNIPRTTLRYAIEKLPENIRKNILNQKFE
jgi:3-methyladenine DNA glycosylase AlkD